jgi:hypothetical protein
LQSDTRTKINETINKLNKPELKLKKDDIFSEISCSRLPAGQVSVPALPAGGVGGRKKTF